MRHRPKTQPPRPPVLGEVPRGSPEMPLATQGILRPRAGLDRFALSRVAPPPALAPFVPFFWTVAWELPPGETFAQEVLPRPCVSVAFEDGAYFVHGPATRRFVARLAGRGWVTGARFTPAGFSAFTRAPLRALVDRVVPAAEVLGGEPAAPATSPDEARHRLGAWLLASAPRPTATLALVDRLVEKAEAAPGTVRVDRLAAEAGVSPRTLHRLFERHVGLSSKTIVRQARVRDAADRVARGETVDRAEVAQDLGYHDQAHLIRDFRAQIGETPAAYARRCAAR